MHGIYYPLRDDVLIFHNYMNQINKIQMQPQASAGIKTDAFAEQVRQGEDGMLERWKDCGGSQEEGALPWKELKHK